MRKLTLLLAIITLVAGVSVQAQIKSVKPRIQPGPPPASMKVLIESEQGEGYFIFNPTTGDYWCNLCEYGYELNGTKGVGKIDGCNVYFSVIEDGYHMFASVNICEQQGKCAIEITKMPGINFDIEPINEYWSDSDMRNNLGQCEPTKK